MADPYVVHTYALKIQHYVLYDAISSINNAEEE